jgi:oligopeptide/dipeptide ABC transporter ATP-binding protein
MNTNERLVEVEGLKKYYPVRRPNHLLATDELRAVDGISFTIRRGETLGMVGESGCGKSTTRKLVLHIEPPTEGTVRFAGEDVGELKGAGLTTFRRRAQVIYQDPYSSLDPTWRVGSIISEALQVHRMYPRRERVDRVVELMRMVGLRDDQYRRYPHEFSGGQRQRIGIARALAAGPEFLVADEPVSALDVSIQAQVLNLLRELQTSLNLTYLFISHDLSVVKYMSDRVAVMYLGHIVETAPTKRLFADPAHPYTQLLMQSIPLPDPKRGADFGALKGEVPSPINPPSGCPFHPRCPYAMDICRHQYPKERPRGENHVVACHLYPESPENGDPKKETT